VNKGNDASTGPGNPAIETTVRPQCQVSTYDIVTGGDLTPL